MDAGADQISIPSTIATALCYIGSWQGIKQPFCIAVKKKNLLFLLSL